MTYWVGIWTRYGLVMASDSRTNAGHDQVNVARAGAELQPQAKPPSS